MSASLSELVSTGRYQTDKGQGYLDVYEELFAPFRDSDIRLLELGIHAGGSVRLWRDYFRNGVIAGLDLEPPSIEDAGERIRLFQGRQEDADLLDHIGRTIAPHGFDIIIDDCAHIGALAEASFRTLFRDHLKAGGIYAVEDWGTGYWPEWPDGSRFVEPGKSTLMSLRRVIPPRVAHGLLRAITTTRMPSHDAGMVGFVKRLVDECGRADIARTSIRDHTTPDVEVSRLLITPGLAVVIKAMPRSD